MALTSPNASTPLGLLPHVLRKVLSASLSAFTVVELADGKILDPMQLRELGWSPLPGDEMAQGTIVHQLPLKPFRLVRERLYGMILPDLNVRSS